MIKKLIKLAVFLFIANAVYQVAPRQPPLRQFKDAVEELALFRGNPPMPSWSIASWRWRKSTAFRSSGNTCRCSARGTRSIINASYVETLQFLPGSKYTWQFDVVAQALR